MAEHVVMIHPHDEYSHETSDESEERWELVKKALEQETRLGYVLRNGSFRFKTKRVIANAKMPSLKASVLAVSRSSEVSTLIVSSGIALFPS
jgi:hypothetical protein